MPEKLGITLLYVMTSAGGDHSRWSTTHVMRFYGSNYMDRRFSIGSKHCGEVINVIHAKDVGFDAVADRCMQRPTTGMRLTRLSLPILSSSS